MRPRDWPFWRQLITVVVVCAFVGGVVGTLKSLLARPSGVSSTTLVEKLPGQTLKVPVPVPGPTLVLKPPEPQTTPMPTAQPSGDPGLEVMPSPSDPTSTKLDGAG